MNANLCDDGDQLWGFHFSVFLTLIRVHLRHPWFIHSLPTSDLLVYFCFTIEVGIAVSSLLMFVMYLFI